MVAGIVAAITIPFVIILLIIHFIVRLVSTVKDERKLIEPNAPHIEIYPDRKPFSKGYTNGVLKYRHNSPNGTTLIEFIPTDTFQGGTEKKPDFISLRVLTDSIIEYGSEWSDRRRKIKIYPRTLTGIPDSIISKEKDLKDKSKESAMKFATRVIEKNDMEAWHNFINKETTLGMTKKEQEQNKAELERMKKVFEEKYKRY